MQYPMAQDVINPTPQTVEPVKIPLPERSKNGRLIGPRYEAFDLLRQQGLSQNRAAQAIGLSPQSGTLIQRKLDRRYDLTNKTFIKLASKVVKNILSGEPTEVKKEVIGKDGQVVEITDKIYPTHPVKLQAAGMIYDRYQPVKGNDTGVSNISFIQINIEDFNV